VKMAPIHASDIAQNITVEVEFKGFRWFKFKLFLARLPLWCLAKVGFTVKLVEKKP